MLAPPELFAHTNLSGRACAHVHACVRTCMHAGTHACAQGLTGGQFHDLARLLLPRPVLWPLRLMRVLAWGSTGWRDSNWGRAGGVSRGLSRHGTAHASVRNRARTHTCTARGHRQQEDLHIAVRLHFALGLPRALEKAHLAEGHRFIGRDHAIDTALHRAREVPFHSATAQPQREARRAAGMLRGWRARQHCRRRCRARCRKRRLVRDQEDARGPLATEGAQLFRMGGPLAVPTESAAAKHR